MEPIFQDILDFWFGEASSKEYGQFRPMWFRGTPEIDHFIRDRFEEIYEEAKQWDFDKQSYTAEQMMALILLFDQFPRNMFRGTSKAFATDNLAHSLSTKAIDLRFDQELPYFMRLFVYMPFEHSENLEDQELSVSLFEKLKDPELIRYALEHYGIVKKFGRFPHRNKILNRSSTLEEIEHLKTHQGF
jgi:uncharacterized protein (DUF924 family)